MSGNNNKTKQQQQSSAFNRLSQSEQFVKAMKIVDRMGLDKKSIMQQAQNMLDGGYTYDAVSEWINNIIQTAGEALARQRAMTEANGGMAPTPEQLSGKQQQPAYSDHNMPPGTYLQVTPPTHPSTQMAMIITTLAGLMDECLRDPKGVNPYNFRIVSLNRFIDRLAERQYWTAQPVEKVESGEMEEKEVTEYDEKTKQKKLVTKKVPVMIDNPHYTLLKKKLKAEQEDVYYEWDRVTQTKLPVWMLNFEGGLDAGEVQDFQQGIENIRKNIVTTLRSLYSNRYVEIIRANEIHHPSQVRIHDDASSKDIELVKQKVQEYQANQITITHKGENFLNLYIYSWPQQDQKGIYTNYLMMGLDGNLR